MPLTSLDPATALVVVDLQRGVVGLPTAHPIQEGIANAAALADAFRRRKLPVVLVNVASRAPGRTEARVPAFPVSPEWFELVPELGRDPGDVLPRHQVHLGRVPRHPAQSPAPAPSRHAARSLRYLDQHRGESTARAAFEHGYHVTLAVDAMTDSSPEAHRNSLERIFPRLGETATTAEVLARVPA